MNEFKLTGGARIGMANATWPFATLTVTKGRLDLNASIIGNLVFRPEDIISIEPCSAAFSSGLKINHRVAKYKEKVIFWTFKDPDEVIRQIRQAGFLDNTSSTASPLGYAIAKRQEQGGFPVKTPFAVGMVVIWNILFAVDIFNSSTSGAAGPSLGSGAITALGLLFLSCALMLISEPFRRIVLKEGRELGHVSRFLYFMLFISGVMMLSILAF